MVTLTAPPDPIKVIVALAVSLALLTDVAVSVTVVFAGSVAGAEYVTALFVAPAKAPQVGEQLLPDWLSVQETPRLDGSFATVAENCCMADGVSEALAGEIATAIGGVTVIFAVAFFVVSEIDVAVNVTVAGLGTLDGAE